MATSKEYIEFVTEQIAGEYDLRYRKMFGEYMVYVNDKPVLLVCDNTVYVKKLDCVKSLMKNANVGVPYDGAKEHYILDIDDFTLSHQVVLKLEEHIPIPKPKKKKSNE